jgi:hypothetical protein
MSSTVWKPPAAPKHEQWCAIVYDAITGIDHAYGPFRSRDEAKEAIASMKEHDELAPWAHIVYSHLVLVLKYG